MSRPPLGSKNLPSITAQPQKEANPVLASNVEEFPSLSWLRAPSSSGMEGGECRGWGWLRAAEPSWWWLPAGPRGRSRAWILILQGQHSQWHSPADSPGNISVYVNPIHRTTLTSEDKQHLPLFSKTGNRFSGFWVCLSNYCDITSAQMR